MAHKRRSLVTFIAFCFFATVALSQNRPTGAGSVTDPNKMPAITVKAMALSDSVPIKGLYYLKNAKEGIPINLPRGGFSEAFVPFSQTQPLAFGIKGPLVDGVPSFRPLIQAKWPDGSPEEVVVFIASVGEGAELRLSAIAFDNGLSAFPPRSIRVMNFTGQNLFAQCGSFRGELAPGPARAIPYPEVKAEPGRTGRFKISLGRMDAEGSPQILFSGWADAWPQARTLLLVVPPQPGSDKPNVKFLVDSIPAPIKKPALFR